jgi:uroporphyrinogen III methyltransferase/synthase
VTPPNHNETPLNGKKILITRAREQSAGFAEQLRKRGAEVIVFPTIEIVPPLRWDGLDLALDQLKAYDWIIFTSVNGVHFFWKRLEERGLKRHLPPSLQVCAIGPATAKGLKEKGVSVATVPREYVAEAVLEEFKKTDMTGKRILLARAKVARDVLPKGLRVLGAEVNVVEVYRTVKPRGGSKKLMQLLEQENLDGIAFTSSSTVNHFVELLKRENLKRVLRGIAIACIGPVTARTVRAWGMNVAIQPKEYTIPALTQAIARYFVDL